MTHGDIYFDHAATGFPKSDRVEGALLRTLRHAGGNPGRSGHRLAMAAAEAVYTARCTVADFFGAECERVIFTQSATYALNLAITALFRPGGRVIISDMEHNAVFRPVFKQAEETGGSFEIFRSDDLADFEEKLSRRTDLVISTHASNVTGRVLPVKQFGELCRERSIPFILDASQTAGHLPLTLTETGADVICAPGHKALGGIQGVGIAVFRDKIQGPVFAAGGSGSYSRSPKMPEELPDRFEAGTPPTPAIAALEAGMLPLTEEAIRKRQKHLISLCRRAEKHLSRMNGVKMLDRSDYRCGILAFTVDALPSEAVAEALAERGICVRGGLHCAPLAHKTLGTEESGCVRLSFGDTNRPEEVDVFNRAMEEILEQKEALPIT